MFLSGSERIPDRRRQRRSDSGERIRSDPERRGEQPAYLPIGERPGGANQWLDPQNGVNYQVAAQTPQYKIDTFDAMRRTPITPPAGGATQLLYNLAGLKRNNSPEIESHYDIQPVIDIFASPDQRDLGGLAGDIEKIIANMRPTLPRGTSIDLRGQVDTMRTSFTRLGLGMIFAVVLVYLVMASTFNPGWIPSSS